MPTLPIILAALIVAPCGCTSSAAFPTPPQPPRSVATLVQAPLLAPAHAASIVVVKHFDQAKARELTVVLAPDTLPDQIDRIHEADQKARVALTALGLEGKAIKAATLAAARAAVRALEAILDEVAKPQDLESKPIQPSPPAA